MADFYLTNPPSFSELVGVLNALSRRVRKGGVEAGQSWQVYTRSFEIITPEGLSIDLTPHELKLLRQLVLTSDNTLENWQILELLNPDADDSSKARIEVLVCRLRKKTGCSRR